MAILNPEQVGGIGGVGDMLKTTYDTNNNGIVDVSSRTESKAIVSSGTILVGQLLSFNDTALDTGRAEVTLADKDITSSDQAVAVAKTGGTAGQEVTIIEYGLVFDDTSTYPDGTVLYLGNSGNVTDVRPTSGKVQVVGAVRYSNVNGDWLFRPKLSNESGIVLQEGELVRYDSATDQYIGTGIIDSATETDFGEKTVKAGTGTFALGGSKSISAAVDSIIVFDSANGVSRSSVDAVIASNVPEARIYGPISIDVVQSAPNTETLTNPSWPITPIGNSSLTDLSFDFHAVMTNVRITLFRDGLDVWSHLSDITSTGMQKILLPIPLQVRQDAASYSISLTSIDGDVLVGGEGVEPQWWASGHAYEDAAMQGLPNGTGVVVGGELFEGTGLAINVGGGYGYRVGISLGVAKAQSVGWDSVADWPLPITDDGIYIIYIDNPDSIAQTSISNLDGILNRDNLILGIVRIDNGAVTSVRTLKTDASELPQQFFDLLKCLGTTRCEGLDLVPTTGLQFQIKEGQLLARGAGSEAGSRLQNTLNVDGVATAVFDTFVGTALLDDYFDALGVSNLDFTQYDSGGGVLASVVDDKYTIQYVYKAPVNTGGVVVMYGQTVYDSMDDALNYSTSEDLTVPQLIVENYLLLGRIVGKSNGVDITDPLQFKFLSGAKFGSSLSGGALSSPAIALPKTVTSLSLDTTLPEISRTISLVGTPDPVVSVNPSHINFVNTPIDFSGALATANLDGTITINQDIVYMNITCMAVTRFASNSNIELGIGIGDPTILPTKAGTSTDVLPLGTYISRFRDSTRGEGLNRETTLQTPYFPVSKTTTIGAKAGDKIFIVAWTQESSNTSVVFDDCVFVVEAFTSY